MAKEASEILKELTEKYHYDVTEEETFIPSGSIIFDAVLSKGRGIPQRKFIQIAGDSGCGKSTTVLTSCKVACAKGYTVVYLDVEKGVNDSQLEGIGLLPYVNKSFFVYKISTFEEAEEIITKALEISNLAYIVIDSITYLVPDKMLKESVSKIEPGIKARYQSTFLEKFKALLERSSTKCSFLFINQMRIKFKGQFIASYEAAGGSAIKFGMDIRVMMKKDKDLEKSVSTMGGSEPVRYGADVEVWCEKNRFNLPYVKGIITILFGRGVSNLSAYQRVLSQRGVLKQGGAGYYYIEFPEKEKVTLRGAPALMGWIKENLSEVKAFVESTGGIQLIDDSELFGG